MAQVSSYNVANRTGAQVRADINDIYDAIKTCNSGTSDPSAPVKFMLYGDSAVGDDNLKIYDGSQFRTIGKVTQDNLGLLPKAGGTMTGALLVDSGGDASAPALAFSNDTDTGIYRVSSNILGISCAGGDNSAGSLQANFEFSSSSFISREDITLDKTNADASLQLGTNSNSHNAIIDLATESGDPTTVLGADFGLRLIRSGGTNGFSKLHHRSDSTTANNLLIESQAGTSGGIVLMTGGTPHVTPASEVVSKSRWAVAGNGTVLAGEAIRINQDPVSATGNVGNGIKFVTASATEEYGSFGLAVNAKDIVGIFNRTGTLVNNTGKIIEFKYNGSTVVGEVTTNGTTTQYVTNPSDRTLKKNFENWSENTLDSFKNLNPQKYNFINEDDTADKDKGFIAQEVASSFPEAYFKNEEDKYMFNPSGMVVYLMKALQETVAKIETLETKVAALEAS